MRFGVLGPLMVWTDQGEPVTLPAGQVRTVLAVLLVHRGRSVSSDRLIDVLWPRRAPRDAAAALQVKVSQLRGALAAAEPSARALVVARAAGYSLDVAADAVDAGRFEQLLALAATEAGSRAAALTTALELWRGAAFTEVADEEFAAVEAARLEELRLSAVEARAEALLELGDHSTLVGELAAVVAEHPLRERLRAAHLRALYRSGRQSEALAGFTDLRERLRTELGVDPGPEIVAVHRAILAQDPVLAPRVSTTNLPGQLTELIGRAEAAHEVRGLVGEYRLVTLIGPGGVGKTRLAIEAARTLLADHHDGVWFVELAGIDAAAASLTTIVDTVHAVLGIRDDIRSPAGPDDRLITALDGKEVLLVLDNCEHLVTVVAELTERLLRSVPGLRVVATSREPLGVSGEALYPVAALELPYSPGDVSAETLPKFSAVRLFAARAAAAAPGFAIDSENAAAVATICRRLDGIPLALELAAARVRALGVRELAARMDDRFELLVAGHRGGPGRQQTLRAVIDWSWEQLTEPEQAVLRRLSVHADGFGLAAAERVCAVADLPRGRVLDLVARLVDRSLVAMTDTDDGPRYRLLESVALYCSDRLVEAGEADLVHAVRNEFYAELAEQARDRLRGADQRRWLAMLDAEYANLRSAVEDSVRRGDSAVALRLVDAVAWYWFLRGRIGEGLRLLEAVLTMPAETASWARATGWRSALMLLSCQDSDRSALVDAGLSGFDRVDDAAGRALIEWLLAEALLGGGDQLVSETLAHRSLRGFRAAEDDWGIAAALSSAAHHALLHGDLPAMERDAAESARLFTALGDRWGQLRTAQLLARRAEIIGDYSEVARLRHDGLRRAEELGLWPQVADMLSGLGRLALLTGDLTQARLLHERARELSVSQGHELGRVFAEVGLGLGARREGRLDDAEKHNRASLDWNRRVDYAPGIAQSLAELGFIAELRGDPDGARAFHEEGMAVAQRTGDPRAIALAQEGLAGAAALAGDIEQARRLLSAAAAAREETGAPLPRAERIDVDRITAAIRAASDHFR
ncbi:BTAD domain-containing putative transcriptional regulator [Nocardia mangyaensis]|uniref:BTAD domain-containing putative transcriptional regulator n=1 Tax=Nocardia mangyaensis TaxID=2213200 RepID=UPI0026761DE1|nr:BTAD domain-containing putative transcriptional regulator [Nocardia mangyaensis]MDO3650422.1 BTAD domain-containing putative transcriptional regulator [Nocardia mangyaensis]